MYARKSWAGEHWKGLEPTGDVRFGDFFLSSSGGPMNSLLLPPGGSGGSGGLLWEEDIFHLPLRGTRTSPSPVRPVGD